MTKYILAVFALVLASVCLAGTTYYVDSIGGSDGGNGTSALLS